MDFNNISSDNKDRISFNNSLISLSDKEYKKFHSSIINTKLEIIGIRMPILKSIAKEIFNGNKEEYLKEIDCSYYETVMLYGLVLSKCNEALVDKYINQFIKNIDNWAICDTFCSSMKFVNNKLGKYWIYFVNLIDLNSEFQTRVSIVMMMNYYLSDNYIDRVLDIVCKIKTDYYYINMAISWLLSVAIIDYKDKVISILKSGILDKFVQNKTISKIQDSYRIDEELKELVKEYRK